MKFIGFFVLTFLCFSACSDSSNGSEMNTESTKSLEKKSNAPEITKTQSRKIIKEGEIYFESSDLKKAKYNVLKVVRTLEGYTSIDRTNTEDDEIENFLEIRIPAENFEKLIQSLNTANFGEISNKDIRANDVTAEYYDLETRLKTKKDLETRYLMLLTKANSIRDLLDIEEQIGKLRSEIEVIEGQFKLIQNQIGMSTLRLTITQNTPEKSNFLQQIKNSLRQGWKGVVIFLLGLISIWPLLIILIILILGVFFVRRLKKKT